jgi:DUF4097 and DUF4098 domain-containing protein YvlB
MRRNQRVIWSAFVLCLFCAVAATTRLHGKDQTATLTAEFHQTYPINANGRVSLENINGAVHISSWDRNEVKVDAVKRANSQKRLDEAKIEVNADSGSISIRTKYPQGTQHWDSDDQAASVEYTLTVPKNAHLDAIKLINGSLDISNINGDVEASCINGRLTAKGLTGEVKLSTINGPAEAQINPSGNGHIVVSSVNGPVDLTQPSDIKGRVEASTVTGGISNDFGLSVNHQLVGHKLDGEIGSGGSRIELKNVNGPIQIHRASDGHSPSAVKDLSAHDDDNQI